MECNKEEAFRAKDIALKKMEAKDFVGARKFVLKAQQLYCDMENISQMICVCDVHCSAESNMVGNDLNWYGILQVEQTADDQIIKKQYRKFALMLHPDKNKFAGAESAFKLIGEAQKVLLDKDKRSFFDMKCRTSCKFVRQNQPPQQASRNINVTKTSRVQNNVSSNTNFHFKFTNQQAQPGAAANVKETFWTQCPFCAVRYQYYKEVLNRALRCQSCKKPFIAYDMLASGARPGTDAAQPLFPGKNFPNVLGGKSGSEAMNKHTFNAWSQSGQNAEASRSQKARQPHKGTNKVEWGSKPSRKVNSKRGKKHEEESSESFGSDSSLESEEVDIQIDSAQQFDGNGDLCTRRSSRNKRNVSYSENVSDNEQTMNPSKKAKEPGPCGPTTEVYASEKRQQPFVSATATCKERNKGECNKSNGSETVVESIKKSFEVDDVSIPSSPETTTEPEIYEYPDPEFCEFDKFREEQCFKVGQLWAVYDTVDAMPRFYAKIRKIYSPGFKLRITWLEPNPDDPLGIDWNKAELPFPCGKFKLGTSDIIEDRPMFSHEVIWEKGGGKDSVFLIYPRKGETWALFKNWDAKWHSIPDDEKRFEFDFVEVLSDFDEIVGIRVSELGKLKGFASVFCRKSMIEIQILPTEVLKFSHKVPSCRLSGNEREDVPKDSFELDPASITLNLTEISLPRSNGDANSVNLSANGEESNPAVKVAEKKHGKNLKDDVNFQDIPDPEFYNFDDQKSLNKFQINQVWALYSDVDGLPKYYGIIKKIDHEPHFEVQLAWMDVCNLPGNIILWKEKQMPISCGTFKIKSNKVQTYTENASFSHQVRAQSTGKNVFDIYPRKDEVWALYKNWNASMKVADLQNCDYDIVEVLDENDSHIKVVDLERVKNFQSVFKPQRKEDSCLPKEISRNELLRFSHQIPSFRLTDERDGSLRGLWELDPAAFPNYLLYKL